MPSTVQRAVLLALTLLTLSGCKLTSSENDFTRQPAHTIAEHAVEEMNALSSVRLLGTVETDSGVTRVDLRLEDSSCLGSLETGHGDLLKVTSASGTGSKSSDKKLVRKLCSLDALLKGFDADQDPDTFEKGEIAEVGGDEAIAVTGSQGKVRMTVWVSIEAPHRVIMIEPARESAAHEALYFDEFVS